MQLNRQFWTLASKLGAEEGGRLYAFFTLLTDALASESGRQLSLSEKQWGTVASRIQAFVRDHAKTFSSSKAFPHKVYVEVHLIAQFVLSASTYYGLQACS
jgi:hypothetical protein